VRNQHASAHRLAAELPDEAEVYPTHGFGSFCSPRWLSRILRSISFAHH
jgi:hypothetical protein